jgi:threonylcarbamoyladenosine tRNA methylthiotransferase MtaB
MNDHMPLRVSVTALGCKVNYAEMADLAGRLAAAGCEVVSDDQAADVRVLNSCTVTVAADATTRQRLRRLRRADPTAHIVLTGCSVDGNPRTYLREDTRGRRVLPNGVDAVFANAAKQDIAEHVLEVAAERGARAVPSRVQSLRSRAFIKVQDGCDHRCTYCSVWRARGASRSVPLADIRQRVADALDLGQVELVLTGVDLGSYGRGQGSTLAHLLCTLLDDVGRQARIRLSSINTNDITGELIELNAHPQLCSHWHMPLQSGSDAILRAMHRGYRRAQYLRVCAALRSLDPNTEFTTDVMVAFPTETEADHLETIALIEETQMLAVHPFRYSPRDDTAAAALEGRIDDASARRRSAAVRRTAAATGRARRTRAVGARHRAVWDRVEAGVAHGISATYLQVVVPRAPGIRVGGIDTVHVESVEGDLLHGRLAGRD